LKAEGLVTSPAFIVMKAADRFANPTTAINQLRETDFTYLKITGAARQTAACCRATSSRAPWPRRPTSCEPFALSTAYFECEHILAGQPRPASAT